MENVSTWTDHGIYPTYDLAVVILRAQPFHNGHAALIQQAHKMAKGILILLGSSFIARNINNPFSFKEREEMIRLFCTDLGLNKEYNKIQIAPLVDDLYNNQQWIATVQAEVANNIVPPARIVLVGHHKDQDSWYLDAFPDYDYSEVPNEDVLNATTIRDVIFC